MNCAETAALLGTRRACIAYRIWRCSKHSTPCGLARHDQIKLSLPVILHQGTHWYPDNHGKIVAVLLLYLLQVRILKSIAQAADFVAFKLDIDNYAAENSILSSLSSDAAAAALVDEFFLEYHVNFQPMVQLGWAGTVDEKKKLADAFKLFHSLRKLGWRAHSWV